MVIALVLVAVAAAACILGAGGGADADLYKYCVYNGMMFDETKKEWVTVAQWKASNDSR